MRFAPFETDEILRIDESTLVRFGLGSIFSLMNASCLKYCP